MPCRHQFLFTLRTWTINMWKYRLIPPYAHPILPFSNLMCALWLPMSYSRQRNRTVRPRYSFFDVPFFIIGKLLSWVGEMFSVHLRWQSKWRATNERILCARELNADQITLEGKQLCHSECPIRTETCWESREKLSNPRQSPNPKNVALNRLLNSRGH